MTNSIDDVIWNCEKTYGLNVTEENRDKFIRFIKRQLRLHEGYDLNFRTSGATKNPYHYLNHLVNKLYTLSILVGESSIKAGYLDNIVERRIGWYSPGDAKTDGTISHEFKIKPKEERYKDLYLLRRSEIGYKYDTQSRKKRTDINLYKLVRVTSSYHYFRLQNWGEIIDELGKEIVVINYFQRVIDYQMVLKSESPNPLTFNHGGYRWNGGNSTVRENYYFGEQLLFERLLSRYKSECGDNGVEIFKTQILPKAFDKYRVDYGVNNPRKLIRDVLLIIKTAGDMRASEIEGYLSSVKFG